MLVQQNLILECKRLVEWLKVSLVNHGIASTLSVYPDTALLPVDKALMDHRMIFHKSNLPSCWTPLLATQINATGSDMLLP